MRVDCGLENRPGNALTLRDLSTILSQSCPDYQGRFVHKLWKICPQIVEDLSTNRGRFVQNVKKVQCVPRCVAKGTVILRKCPGYSAPSLQFL